MDVVNVCLDIITSMVGMAVNQLLRDVLVNLYMNSVVNQNVTIDVKVLITCISMNVLTVNGVNVIKIISTKVTTNVNSMVLLLRNVLMDLSLNSVMTNVVVIYVKKIIICTQM